MTPHYGPYYQDGEVPGDWHNPIPIPFLVVEEGTNWQVTFLSRAGQLTSDEIEEFCGLVAQALLWSGAGAKTAVGYGRFDRVPAQEESWRRKSEEQRKLAEVSKAKKDEFVGLSQGLRELRELADDQGWSDNEKFLAGLEAYLDGRIELEKEAAFWLRDNFFEPRSKGIWANPDELAGKKSKPKHKPRWANLVKKIRALIP